MTTASKIISQPLYRAICDAAQQRFVGNLATARDKHPKANAEYYATEPDAHREACIALNAEEEIHNAERNAVLDLAAALYHHGEPNCCGRFWLDVLDSLESTAEPGA